MSVTDVVLGRPLANEEDRQERVGVLRGIPLLGLDALASAAYGPEAALTVLLPLGAAGLRAAPVLLGLIVGLLAIVCASYRQTITAYPSGGGSYTVARENLGARLGVLAGAALALDYILNVAVAISAGVGAVVSALPRWQPHTLALCLGVLFLLTVVNLRGVRDAGLVFLGPTYLFVACMLLVFTVGLVASLSAGGHPAPRVAPPRLPDAAVPWSLWIAVRAFANGCTAMTGVEAVSNGITIFRAPTRPHARRTLTTIVVILAALLVGIAVLSQTYRVGATRPGGPGYQSVLSQLIGAIVGRGVVYYVAMSAIFAVLVLSANTSFSGFPRLARVMAVDGYLPKAFANRGRRLVFSSGIVVLALLAGILLLAFGGVTDRLIPLFAVGAFLAFTLSQAGMVRHWKRVRGARWRRSLALNAVGAAATGFTLVVVVVSKLAEGAWVSVLLVGGMMLLFSRVHAHYATVRAATEKGLPLDVSGLAHPAPPVVIVPIGHWSRVANRALRFAVTLSPDVHAVQVLGGDSGSADLRPRWDELVAAPLRGLGRPVPRLDVLRSSYRRLFAPLLSYVHRVQDEHPGRDVAVVVPELVPRRWYHALLHTHRATVLKALLRVKGGPRVIIIDTPWHLRD